MSWTQQPCITGKPAKNAESQIYPDLLKQNMYFDKIYKTEIHRHLTVWGLLVQTIFPENHLMISLNPLGFPVSSQVTWGNGFSHLFYSFCRYEGLDTTISVIRSPWWSSFVIIAEFLKIAFGPALSLGYLGQELGQDCNQYVESLGCSLEQGMYFPYGQGKREPRLEVADGNGWCGNLGLNHSSCSD